MLCLCPFLSFFLFSFFFDLGSELKNAFFIIIILCYYYGLFSIDFFRWLIFIGFWLGYFLPIIFFIRTNWTRTQVPRIYNNNFIHRNQTRITGIYSNLSTVLKLEHLSKALLHWTKSTPFLFLFFKIYHNYNSTSKFTNNSFVQVAPDFISFFIKNKIIERK